jgi:hypothetical protein
VRAVILFVLDAKEIATASVGPASDYRAPRQTQGNLSVCHRAVDRDRATIYRLVFAIAIVQHVEEANERLSAR